MENPIIFAGENPDDMNYPIGIQTFANPQTWANYTSDDTFHGPMFDRGFTGHEHLYDFGLINMNGRMYDPVMSSFLSADRFVQNPMSAQGFNRYAYCMNNPLRYVDPTGWLSGGGGGGPGGPLPKIFVDGHASYILPEVTIRPNDPTQSNTFEYEEYEYTPNITSGGFDNGWGNTSSWSSDRQFRGSGGGNGNHGGSSNVQPNQKTNLEIASDILITANLNAYIYDIGTPNENPVSSPFYNMEQARTMDYLNLIKVKGIDGKIIWYRNGN